MLIFFRAGFVMNPKSTFGAILISALILGLSSLTGTASADTPPAQRLAAHRFPKLFIQIQQWDPGITALQSAAGWDLIILDAEIIPFYGDRILGPGGYLRTRNPASVILNYFSAGDLIANSLAPLNNGFQSIFDTAWYLRDTSGRIIDLCPFPDGTWSKMINLDSTVNRTMAAYLNEMVIRTGLSDGIFYDNISDTVSWVSHRNESPNGPIDLDGDGTAESDQAVDSAWQTGTAALLANSRELFGGESLIVGNGGWIFDGTYAGQLNGRMVENFLQGAECCGFDWAAVMSGVVRMAASEMDTQLSLIMTNGVWEDYDRMRLGLCSALMVGAYSAYTNPNGSYLAAWWYDEYSVDLATGQAVTDPGKKGYLGQPRGAAHDPEDPDRILTETLLGGDGSAGTQVWRRDFENGIVLVNPTPGTMEVDLGGEFRKILGEIDPAFNDGSVVSRISLPPTSGVILLNP